MGKASRNKRVSAREKIAAQREAQRRAEQRRRMLITGGAVLGVVVVVIAFVVLRGISGSSAAKAGKGGSSGATTLSAAVVKNLTTVPAATLDKIGPGSAYSKTVTAISGTPLTSGGKPEILYIGAEYCPFCAAERWAMAVALSRFGTFSGLHGVRSSGSDAYPNTATLTFYKSTYTSKYIAFTPVETTTVDRNKKLQKLSASQQALFNKYDFPPYIAQADRGAIPFIDLGNKYLVHGAQYSPQVLKGLTWSQIAAALHDPSSAVATGADGAANNLTAGICKLTGNQPANVCTAPAIKALQGQL